MNDDDDLMNMTMTQFGRHGGLERFDLDELGRILQAEVPTIGLNGHLTTDDEDLGALISAVEGGLHGWMA